MKKLLYFISLFLFLLPFNVFAATDTSFSTDYNWYNPKTKSGDWTDYRTGVSNNVYLQGGITAENFNTYNLEVLRSISNEWKNVSMTKDNLYAFYYTITIDNIQNEEVLPLDFINNSSNFYISSENAELLSSSLISNYWEYTGLSEVNYNPVEVGIQTIKLKFIVKATNTDNSTHLVITKNLNDYIVGRHIAITVVRVTSSSYELITDNTLINKQDELISQQEQTNNKLDEANNTSKGIWGTIKEVLTNIIELPKKLVELIIDALKNLFVPTDEQLYEIINDSKDLTENFGFVGESVNFFIEIFTALLGMVNGNGCIEFPAFKMGATSLFSEHTFWEASQVCLNDNVILSNNINTIRTITSIVLVGLFLNFASSKFFSILSKNDNERANADVGDMNGVVR